jgi:Ca2+:H+ antiporter
MALRWVWGELRRTPILWLLLLVPVVFVVEKVAPHAYTLLFLLSVAAIIGLATLLGLATESVAAKTGDTIGGLLNASLGNLTELVVALTALRAGLFDLVKASIGGAIVTKSLLVLGLAFLLGGIRHHVQEFNPLGARLQTSLLFLAAVTLLVPSALTGLEELENSDYILQLSVGLSVLLLIGYVLGLVFSLGTHRKHFAAKEAEASHHEPWSIGVAVSALAVSTVLTALVSEIFVESVQFAAESLGMSAAFVGFIVVSFVGGVPEALVAISAARKNRLDLSISIALGSAAQFALFVAPVLVLASYALAPSPMDLAFNGGQVVATFLAMFAATLVVSTGRSAWFTGAQLIMVYSVFAITLYLLPV